jgi:hypothetical protein
MRSEWGSFGMAWKPRKEAHSRSDENTPAIELFGGMNGMVALQISSQSIMTKFKAS